MGIPFEEISFKRTFQIFSHFIYILEFIADTKKAEKLEELIIALIAENKQKKRPKRSFERIFYRPIRCHSKSK